MCKEIVIISLLVAVATSFPSNGIKDLGTTRVSEENNPANVSEVVSAEHKSLIPFITSSGNPDEIIEESANSTETARKTRSCILTIAGDCSENGVDVEELLLHVEQVQQAAFDHIDEAIEDMPDLLAMILAMQQMQ